MFIGVPGPYQRQSSKSEIGQVIAQSLTAVGLLVVVSAQVWLQARIVGRPFGVALNLIGVALVAWVAYRRRLDLAPTILALIAVIVGLALAAWPPRRLGAFGDGGLRFAFSDGLARLVGISDVAVPYSAVVLATVLNALAAGVMLLTALRMVIEVIFPNMLNSIRSVSAMFGGLDRWWSVRYGSDPAGDGEPDVPENGDIKRRGVRTQ